MKTKKEIKPFKMRCESLSEFKQVKILLEQNYVNQAAASGVYDMLINAYLEDGILVYTTFEKHFEEPEPELTYSEFMKLYGEEEVFTREDMKAAMSWAISLFHNRFTEWCEFETENNVLDNFLSERTND